MLALLRRLLGRLAETFLPWDLFDVDLGDAGDDADLAAFEREAALRYQRMIGWDL